MKIGLLSDTHGWLDPKIFDHLEKCDEVWHAGDIGDAIPSTTFNKFKHFRAVYGNIDGSIVRRRYPEIHEFTCQKIRVWMIHIGGFPPIYTPKIQAKFNETIPDILVCGHTHILQVMHDIKHPPLLYINPGAAGRNGFHYMRTLLRFEINGTKINNIEIIELGTRSKIV